jgi:hypothetical protein
MTLHEYDVVALTAEIQAIHKATSQPILLRPGQVGTILMSFDDRAYLVDLPMLKVIPMQWKPFLQKNSCNSFMSHFLPAPNLQIIPYSGWLQTRYN